MIRHIICIFFIIERERAQKEREEELEDSLREDEKQRKFEKFLEDKRLAKTRKQREDVAKQEKFYKEEGEKARRWLKGFKQFQFVNVSHLSNFNL